MLNETCDYCGCPTDRWYEDEDGMVICVDCNAMFFPESQDSFWEAREVRDDYYEDTYGL